METTFLLAFGILQLILGINTETMLGYTRNSNACIVDLGGKSYTFYPGQMIKPSTACMECTCEKSGADSQFNCRGCGVIGNSNPNCRVVTKKYLLHPECCPDLVCN
ncbi:unnamed protein product [Gordionus sp. m RMFG-2023]|uniref:U-scoloptoxin(16)-Ssd1a-like n=1 Tax=Gordionus sp. m RMFG-2023 TaxID=3053472 RepID=UPI0030DE2C1F